MLEKLDFLDDQEETQKDSTEKRNEAKNADYLNFGEDDQMEIQGFAFSKLKTYLVSFGYVLTFGLLRLFFHWHPHLHLIAGHSRCRLEQAEKVLIIDSYKSYKSYFVKDVKEIGEECKQSDKKQLMDMNLSDGTTKKLIKAKIIKCKKLTYVWDDDRGQFFKLSGFDKGITKRQLHGFGGQSLEQQNLRRIIYGFNEINVPVQTILTLLALEALTPFYIFQVFSLIVWLSEMYYYYTIAIIIMSVVGITTSIIQTRKNQKNLKGTVHTFHKVKVCRGNGIFEEVPSTKLVPGDLILIPSKEYEVNCDAVLLSGTCIVNESMLTGESVPITKTALPNESELYDIKVDGNHTLFCGTKIIQTRTKGNEKILAVVIRTGYLTTKGELVRSILYPPPAEFQFEKDSYKFIAILSLVAVAGSIYTIYSKSARNIKPLDIIIKSLDLITIAVPPALPAAMTVGKLYALSRLKNKEIFCINSRIIDLSGSVDCVCFDKTGTLTEDQLDMWGVVPIDDDKIMEPINDVRQLSCDGSIVRGMAACHALSIIDGLIQGDILDVKMFKSTGWLLQEQDAEQNQDVLVRPAENSSLHVSLKKHFQFSSTLQRMSVIVKSSDKDHYEVFCKGSPERIASLSLESSVPKDFFSKLKEYTTQGYRVIALSKKSLFIEDISKLTRDQVESNLEFIGFVILENKLKPVTTSVIETLNAANLRTVMITGDNIQTAVHVARDCKIVNSNDLIVEVIATYDSSLEKARLDYKVISERSMGHSPNQDCDIEGQKSINNIYCFAVTGDSWSNILQYFPNLVARIVSKGKVFARMSGKQKQQLIEELKYLGYYVAMCGDGANDCGALKAAHVGISLSELESSVASPFTSKKADISCVPEVIREGRAALTTSFGVFKMMLCYSLTEFASCIILYSIDCNLSSLQFLFIDICLILNFASFFGITKAHPDLSATPPMTSLMSFIPVSSIVCFTAIVTGFQIFSYRFIQRFDWFVPYVFDENQPINYLGYENYAVFSVSTFQYIAMAVVFSKGKPYRKALYTNYYFALSLIVTSLICVYMMLCPAKWVANVIEILLPPKFDGRYAMLIISLFSFITCWFVEDVIVDLLLAKVVMPIFRKLNKTTSDDQVDYLLNSNSKIFASFREEEEKGLVNFGYVDSDSKDTAITRC